MQSKLYFKLLEILFGLRRCDAGIHMICDVMLFIDDFFIVYLFVSLLSGSQLFGLYIIHHSICQYSGYSLETSHRLRSNTLVPYWVKGCFLELYLNDNNLNSCLINYLILTAEYLTLII